MRHLLLSALFVFAASACHDAADSTDAGAGDATEEVADTARADAADGSGTACRTDASGATCLPEPPRSRTNCGDGGAWASAYAPEFSVCAPEPPRLATWSCPDGWLQPPLLTDGEGRPWDPLSGAEFSRCEPPPLPEDCATDEGSWPGATSCVPIGPACPGEESWAEDGNLRERAPGFSGSLRFVREGAESGGDGSRERPWASIADAVAMAEPGDILAISAGTWEEALVVREGIALLGACVTGTVLRAPDESGTATIQLTGAGGALLDGFTVTGPRPGVHAWDTAVASRVSNVVVADVMEGGVLATRRAELSLERVVVRGVGAGDAHYGGAGLSFDDATGDLRFVTVRDVASAGITILSEGAEVTGEDLLIDGVSPDAAGQYGRGIDVDFGARASFRRLYIARSMDMAVRASGAGTSLSLTEFLLDPPPETRRTELAASGIDVGFGARLMLERGVSRGLTGVALVCFDEVSSVTGVDLVFEDIDGRERDGRFGIAVVAADGCPVDLQRTVILRHGAVGAQAQGELLLDDVPIPSRVSLTDSVVAWGRGEDRNGGAGMGLGVMDSARVEATRVLLAQNRSAGANSNNSTSWDEGEPPAQLVLTDVRISDTRLDAAADGAGHGINVEQGTDLTLERVWVERSAVFGVRVVGSSSVARITDLSVVDTFVDPTFDIGGWGLHAAEDVVVNLTGAIVESNHTFGVYATEGAILNLEDIVVAHTLPSISEIGGMELGRGIDLSSGAQVTVTRGVVTDNGDISVFADSANTEDERDATTLTLRDVVVRRTRSREVDGFFGRGVEAGWGSRMQLERVAIVDNRDIGLFAAGREVSVHGVDVAVQRTQPSSCVEWPEDDPLRSICPDRTSGTGFVAVEQAELALQRFLASEHPLIGVIVALDARFEGEQGLVSDNLVGIHVQEMSQGMNPVFESVRVERNGVDWDSQVLPLPSSGGLLDELDE